MEGAAVLVYSVVLNCERSSPPADRVTFFDQLPPYAVTVCKPWTERQTTRVSRAISAGVA